MNEELIDTGYISAINSSLIEIKGIKSKTRLYDLIRIVNHDIYCEVIKIYEDHIVAQCFENTSNLKLNEPVINLHEPLSMELGPGLLGHVFDGIQRPLELTFDHNKDGFLQKGTNIPPLSREKKWYFTPKRKVNESLQPGDVIGTVQEGNIIHKILIPPNTSGILIYIAEEGYYTILEEIYKLKIEGKSHSFNMLQKWPINKARPYNKRITPNAPLITGIRMIDLLFPIAKGGTCAVPGGFGTGKTIIQQTIAKYSNADIIIYVGCGEPGNEIANILRQFTEIYDVDTGEPLLDHIVLLTNTSNMPVSAREASLFSGVTIGEYYRDMGYDVAVIVDSTSRWAEALREISSLLEEMPAEEGYPAYLPSKISSFYERAGVVSTIGVEDLNKKNIGSLTIIGSISPPAGDFNEPVTAATKRVVQGLWALDPKLAYLKQYPAIDWLNSYSNYPELISNWWNERNLKWDEFDYNWMECRNQVNKILSIENELKLLMELTGDSDLLKTQDLEIFIARLIRNGFLLQNNFDINDLYTSPEKLLGIIKLYLLIYQKGKELLKRNMNIEHFLGEELIEQIKHIANAAESTDIRKIEELKESIINMIRTIKY
ncbi:MAG: V-type ATP synthase subunit A [Promethearchaeota archaeon]